MKKLLPILIFSLVRFNDGRILSRTTRNLIFQDGAALQLIFGFGLPVAFDEYSILMGTVTKFHYDLPTNSTAYTERSTASRWSLYSKLEAVLQRAQLEGKACILRAICEAADGSLRHNGLIGEILHILLTPSTSRDSRGANRDYHGAERLGCKASGHCHVLYKECRLSLLDLISQTNG